MSPECGAVAQSGERVVRNDEVRGSIPLGSTIYPVTIRHNHVLRVCQLSTEVLSLYRTRPAVEASGVIGRQIGSTPFTNCLCEMGAGGRPWKEPFRTILYHP